MSASHYDWLDDESAERLLNGQAAPDDFDFGASAEQRDRRYRALADLLSGMVGPVDAFGALGGEREEAAMSAFRRARSDRARSERARAVARAGYSDRPRHSTRAPRGPRPPRLDPAPGERAATAPAAGRPARNPSAPAAACTPSCASFGTPHSTASATAVGALAGGGDRGGAAGSGRGRRGVTARRAGSVRSVVASVVVATALAGGVAAATAGMLPSPFDGGWRAREARLAGHAAPAVSGQAPGAGLPGPASDSPTGLRAAAIPVPGVTLPPPVAAHRTPTVATDSAPPTESVVRLCRAYLAAESGHGGGLRPGLIRRLTSEAGPGHDLDSFCRDHLPSDAPTGVPSSTASAPALGSGPAAPPPCCPTPSTPSAPASGPVPGSGAPTGPPGAAGSPPGTPGTGSGAGAQPQPTAGGADDQASPPADGTGGAGTGIPGTGSGDQGGTPTGGTGPGGTPDPDGGSAAPGLPGGGNAACEASAWSVVVRAGGPFSWHGVRSAVSAHQCTTSLPTPVAVPRGATVTTPPPFVLPTGLPPGVGAGAYPYGPAPIRGDAGGPARSGGDAGVPGGAGIGPLPGAAVPGGPPPAVPVPFAPPTGSPPPAQWSPHTVVPSHQPTSTPFELPSPSAPEAPGGPTPVAASPVEPSPSPGSPTPGTAPTATQGPPSTEPRAETPG